MNSNSITALKMANDFIKSMGYQSKKNFHSLSILKNKGTHNNWGNRKKKNNEEKKQILLIMSEFKMPKMKPKKWNDFYSLKSQLERSHTRLCLCMQCKHKSSWMYTKQHAYKFWDSFNFQNPSNIFYRNDLLTLYSNFSL